MKFFERTSPSTDRYAFLSSLTISKIAVFCFFLLAFLYFKSLWPPFFSETFEADYDISRIFLFVNLFSGNMDNIVSPNSHVYFDGIYILYALFIIFVIIIKKLSFILFFDIQYGNLNTLAIFTGYFINTLFLSLSLTTLYVYINKKLNDILLSFVLLVMLATSYQAISAFNILRIDAVILSCFIIILTFSCSVLDGYAGTNFVIFSGIIAGILCNFKWTSFIYMFVPLLSLYIMRNDLKSRKYFSIFTGVSVVTFIL